MKLANIKILFSFIVWSFNFRSARRDSLSLSSLLYSVSIANLVNNSALRKYSPGCFWHLSSVPKLTWFEPFQRSFQSNSGGPERFTQNDLSSISTNSSTSDLTEVFLIPR